MPPPIFLKLLGFKDCGMERYPSPKLAAEIHFFCPKNGVKNETKYKDTKKKGAIWLIA